MPKIQQLPAHEAQKIAAGQVVERPANVIKELIENAIDADATHISITIKDGGKQLMRIMDNGCGMDEADAQACFKQHATSKITSVDQLPSLTTFGFRGEALASIAAVSMVTLRTKTSDSSQGTEVIAQDGTIAAKPTACPQGTDISVQNLFYNVPARAKFLKKRETENRHIIQTIKAICLAYPHLHIELTVDDTKLLNCPAQEDLVSRYAQLWDKSTSEHMIPISASNSAKGIVITGAISNHQWFRYDRSGIFFLVNNRWVGNYALGRALLNGYSNVLPHGRYPMAAINIMINPALIDVNSHPRKEEIIFANPRIVEQLIKETVIKTLEKQVSKQIKKEVSFYQPQSNENSFAFTPAAYTALDEMPPALDFSQTKSLPPALPESSSTSQTMAQSTHQTVDQQQFIQEISKPAIPILETQRQPYRILGQLLKTYILLEKEDGLYMVDQHAAHERILYELFGNRFEKLPTINLMFPQLITLDAKDLELLERYVSLLSDHGITIEPFGKDQVVIQSTPVHLKDAPVKEIIDQLIAWAKEHSAIDQKELEKLMHNKLRAQMACKAAVKAGDELSIEQMNELIEDLDKTANRFSCPHGRPTGWLISQNDIEKKFKRRN